MFRKRILLILTAFALLATFILPNRTIAATQEEKVGIVNVSKYPLNVRKTASTSSSVLTTLKKGSYITLVSKSGNWWRVKYAEGAFGYCYAEYIQVVDSASATVATKSGVLNIRSGAGTSYKIIGKLQKGEQILVLSTKNGWSKVLYNGKRTGYVSAKYLKQSAAPTYAAISLNVPYFSQTDSRWANVTLGSSGKTIGTIGCTTTAVAMVESYMQGKIIYPDAMSKRLSYTSGGSLYWPNGYVGVTDKLDLAHIYQLLAAGKPVIVGCKTSTGRQHWAVITGFVGGNQLTADGFTINDPGTQSRNTLQLLMNKNPIFHKYVYVQ